MRREAVRLRVPASSANLGPGFDALGLALGIYLTCTFEPADQLTIRATGRDADRIPTAEDNLIWQTALLKYSSGATGVIQASTAFWPGYPERVEIHGTKGTAVISGDKLTTWDVENDSGEPAPVDREVASGASDPMAISLVPFERQFLDFGDAIRTGRKPLSSGEDGYKAVELVISVYESCRDGCVVRL